MSRLMRKKDCFTIITPIPSFIPRRLALNILHSHPEVITLNPLVLHHTPIPAPRTASSDEFYSTWYEITERIQYVPGLGNLGSGKISFTGCFHDMPWGLQTHIYAPMNVDLRNNYRICGNESGERPEAPELGLESLGAPRDGLYLREDIEIRCNIAVMSFVRAQLKAAGKEMVNRIIKKAELLDAGVLQAMFENGKLRTVNPNDRSDTATQEAIARGELPASPYPRAMTPIATTTTTSATPPPYSFGDFPSPSIYQLQFPSAATGHSGPDHANSRSLNITPNGLGHHRNYSQPATMSQYPAPPPQLILQRPPASSHNHNHSTSHIPAVEMPGDFTFTRPSTCSFTSPQPSPALSYNTVSSGGLSRQQTPPRLSPGSQLSSMHSLGLTPAPVAAAKGGYDEFLKPGDAKVVEMEGAGAEKDKKVTDIVPRLTVFGGKEEGFVVELDGVGMGPEVPAKETAV